jgi:hypothetical protein
VPADEEAGAVEPAEPAGLGLVLALVLLLLLHAARAPGTTARLAVAASPLIAERRENAPDLAGAEGLSVMATPRGKVQECSADQRAEQNMNSI